MRTRNYMPKSTQSFNPYQPPDALLEQDTEDNHGLWCDATGEYLIVERNASLFPDRCVKCDQLTQGYRLKRSVSWLNPWVYLLIFVPYVGLLLLIIFGLIMRKKTTITVGVCEKHRILRRNGIILGWLIFPLNLLLGYLMLSTTLMELQGLVVFTPLIVVIGIVISFLVSRIVYAKKITRNYILLGGVSKKFIEHFPIYDKTR